MRRVLTDYQQLLEFETSVRFDIKAQLMVRSVEGSKMKFVAAAAILFSMCGVSLADNDASRFKIENGNIIIAQSYCGICNDSATSCRLACNGSGTCLQACDEKLRICREQNCGARYRR